MSAMVLTETDGEANFWFCDNGHSMPSRVGDALDVSVRGGVAALRSLDPCPECGGVLRMKQRGRIAGHNAWL